MTPAELNREIWAFTENRKVQQKNQIVQAYYTAALQRCKKMPKIGSLLDELDKTKPKKKAMTPDEMFRVVQQLNAAFGGD